MDGSMQASNCIKYNGFYASDLNVLNACAHDVKKNFSRNSNPGPVDPKASVLPTVHHSPQL